MATCFVSIPPGAQFDALYNRLLIRTVVRTGLQPVRSEELYAHGAITDQIRSGVSEASVCVVDLTGRSISVLYVLGVVHAMAKPVVLLVQNPDDLPYDLRFVSYIHYRPGTAGWEDMLSLRLEAAIRDFAS